ncbi:helix-turn-helix domain-containing protein [Verrucomicrobiota bacterium]
MNKISLVSRRNTKCVKFPTRASLRARERFNAEKTESLESLNKETPDTNNVCITKEKGVPTLTAELNHDQNIEFGKTSSEYLNGKNQSEIMAMVTKENMGDKWELKIQLMPEHFSQMLNTKQTAKMLGVSVSTIYSLVRKGIIPATKVGNSWRFVWYEVLNALKRNMLY